MKLFPLPASVSVLFDIIKSGVLICRFYSDNYITGDHKFNQLTIGYIEVSINVSFSKRVLNKINDEKYRHQLSCFHDCIK